MLEYRSKTHPINNPEEINPYCVSDLVTWCRIYAKDTPISNPLIRFNIGVYQIGQALEWMEQGSQAIPVVYQNLAAFCIHTITSVELVGLSFEDYFEYCNFFKIPARFELDYRILILNISKMIQLLFYLSGSQSYHKMTTERKKRLKKPEIGHIAFKLVEHVVGFIPGPQWGNAVENEVEILLGRG